MTEEIQTATPDAAIDDRTEGTLASTRDSSEHLKPDNNSFDGGFSLIPISISISVFPTISAAVAFPSPIHPPAGATFNIVSPAAARCSRWWGASGRFSARALY